MEPTGDNIRRLREAQGMSGYKLAKLADITPGYLRDIETGRNRNPGVAVVRKVAKALGVDPGVLLREPEEAEGGQ
jgi:transcriptional regulator with XRE-family HTH domain